MKASTSKVYVEILRQIRTIIEQDGLSAGDKIPSERELAERLNVGRSSVREALRALELLGMIETRRGEGTFIKDFRDHHLVDLLGTFILQDSKAVLDLLDMNNMLEKNALNLLLETESTDEYMEKLAALKEQKLDHRECMMELVALADNRLLFRIWVVLNEYVRAALPSVFSRGTDYTELIGALAENDRVLVYQAYEKLALKENVE
ncbi:GntR family transcriptional regulator [Bacillus lacus]|uniref:GntR family transcriptional regulator n=1 Tax=Metabacillus lacus TaxID=1983721 RepID=A0A7X2IXQ0_9BACI|nr:GntR family transcriptional regulator [Metabacillus lacus]MRX71746.1 GntR family transcriptional regulator [Metabacillus lacus]